MSQNAENVEQSHVGMTDEVNYESDVTVELYGDDEVAQETINEILKEIQLEIEQNEVKTKDDKGKNLYIGVGLTSGISNVAPASPRVTHLKLETSKFSGGEGENLIRWLTEIKVAISAQSLHSSELQVAFAMSRLRGRARDWHTVV